MKCCFAIAGAGTLAFAMYLSDGMGQWPALDLVLVSLALAIASATLRFSGRAERWARRALIPMLGSVAGLSFLALLLKRPGYYLQPDANLGLFQCGVAACAIVAASYAMTAGSLATARFPVIAGLFLLMGAWTIQNSPSPMIDVWHFQQDGVEHLIHGENPYAHTYEDIYGTEGSVYSARNLVDGRVVSFTYTPLVLILGMPGRLLGDVRWSLLASTGAAGVFLVLMLRRLGWPTGHPLELGAVALLFHPRGFMLIEQAWTEPYTALTVCAIAWALADGRSAAGASRPVAAIAMSLISKQYAALLLPGLAMRKDLRPRHLLAGVAGAAAMAAPFVLWDPPAFWRGVVEIQMHQPFRRDALSVLAAIAATTGVIVPAVVGFAAAGLVAGLVVWRARRDPAPGDWATCGAATCLAFFVFNKQAFLNYYWLAGILLLVGGLHIRPAVRATAPMPPTLPRPRRG